MNQSKLLGRLQMTHSRIIEQNSKNQNQNQSEERQYFDMLAKSAHKSYIGHKSHNIKQVKQLDGKQLMQQRKKIFTKSTIYPKTNKQIQSKPDYDIVRIESVSNKQGKTCNCFGQFTDSKHQLQIIEDKILVAKDLASKSVSYVFNFDTVEASLQQSFSIYQSKQFILNSGALKLKISHESKETIRYWFEKIKLIIKQSFGVKFQMHDLSIKYPSTFYKTRFQTQDYFTQNCQTGDILLFQDDHFFAKAQRFITNSNYDHVAMVIKDKTYGVLMFQANSMSGVTLTPWNCVVKYGWYECINRIVWRKLEEVDRGGYFQKIVHQFIRANLKQNYYISFDKLLSNQSYIAKKTQQKGFFCSELIATVYKDLELLTRDKQSKDYMPGTKFYPYHFSQKFDLKLQMGKLSPQYQVHFNKKMLQNAYGQFLQQK